MLRGRRTLVAFMKKGKIKKYRKDTQIDRNRQIDRLKRDRMID